MAVDRPRDLFLYELGAMHDAERRSGELFGTFADSVSSNGDLSQLFRTQRQESDEQFHNVDRCFRVLGAAPIHIPSTTVAGMREGFEELEALQPPPEILELFTLGAALRLAHFGIASYSSLLDRALLMKENECAQWLETNLIQKEEIAGNLERVSHEMGLRVLAA
ncbi:MAG: DUF892 family protein [Micromonosporaceae bacterium]